MKVLNWLFGPNSLFRKTAPMAVDLIFSPSMKVQMVKGLETWAWRQTSNLDPRVRNNIITMAPQLVDELEKVARRAMEDK